jgi:hypothetical protein
VVDPGEEDDRDQLLEQRHLRTRTGVCANRKRDGQYAS